MCYTVKKEGRGDGMRLKKILWVIVMIVLLGALIFVIRFRQDLYDEVILGGSEDVFVPSGKLTDPLAEYSGKTGTEAENESDHTGSGAKYDHLIFPNVQIEDWNFIVISARSEKKGYTPTIETRYDGSVKLDARIAANIVQFMDAAHKEGFTPYIAVSYVSYTSQQQLMNEEAMSISEKEGIDFAAARAKAAERIEEPGTSDHQTGLAFDIYDKESDAPDPSQMDPAFFAWMDENCAKYGFIKRYPANKERITGRNEPWHYRYVGIASAEFIMENGLSLEEFIEHYEYQK